MRGFAEVARTGLTAARLHPRRSAATVAGLVAVLLPYTVGLGLAGGLRAEAEAAARAAPDLTLTAEQFGRPVPLPLSTVEVVRAVPGVDRVTPRVVGRVELGQERVAAEVVGVPPDAFPVGAEGVEGRLPANGPRNELVVGSELARRLNLRVGALLPPFYRNRSGERISEVVGVVRPDGPVRLAGAVLTTVETAAHLFDQPGLATELAVDCGPGYEEAVGRALVRAVDFGPARLRVTSRGDLAEAAGRDPAHREGAFTAVFVLAFAAAVLVVLVTSGFGSGERRREVGVLKATGWGTDDVMVRALAESLALSLAGAALAVLLAAAWLKLFNGYWVAGVFLPGVDRAPGFRVPSRLAGPPVLVAFLVSLAVVLCGTLYPTWRAAVTPPRAALR